ncbi:uncharacterized protein LACBIDRAFT_311354 [Laccaria bicolor S238N-H82]|uniref:Predicted protein n=1 Tax=Laccaria bicolor (strain S238N-H82 / ATCC MYA-4686) TaxID=486041 RepID=B0CZT7_LACBS|nr:uncharacterized protein LACBIDRAFT_311354 [Laccaria bicolor S238N-H82]EDR12211.1 predicted protein [Laccaria bicolor S238N-H82]|eukprot:XP_001876475.1 predicted protein [Laccaria bicolor S238N-H82]
MQPNTKAGIVAWHAQLREWKTNNGETAKVTVNTGFPVQPGGAAPGSGECYRCGRGGHCSNCKPAKNQSAQRIDLVIHDVESFYTYFSKGLLGSYSPLFNP